MKTQNNRCDKWINTKDLFNLAKQVQVKQEKVEKYSTKDEWVDKGQFFDPRELKQAKYDEYVQV